MNEAALFQTQTALANSAARTLNTVMDEIEVPTEHLHEQIQEHMHEHGGNQPRWIMAAALLSALIAVFAAISSLKAGGDVNEAMMAQIESSDQWGYYQAKSIKASVMAGRKEAFQMSGKAVPQEITDKLEKYEKDLEDSSQEAKAKEHQSKEHIARHEIFATAVTLFQIAIAMTAICVLVRRKQMLYISLIFMICGLVFFARGLLHPII